MDLPFAYNTETSKFPIPTTATAAATARGLKQNKLYGASDLFKTPNYIAWRSAVCRPINNSTGILLVEFIECGLFEKREEENRSPTNIQQTSATSLQQRSRYISLS